MAIGLMYSNTNGRNTEMDILSLQSTFRWTFVGMWLTMPQRKRKKA